MKRIKLYYNHGFYQKSESLGEGENNKTVVSCFTKHTSKYDKKTQKYFYS